MIPISDDPGRRYVFPFVNIALILTSILVFLYQSSLPDALAERFIYRYALIPADLVRHLNAPGELLTVLTAMFMHANLLHVGSNMLFLWVFGDNVEDAMGHAGYLVFYLVCGVLATVAQVLVDPLSTVPNVGASGAIAGVLAAYLLLFPHAGIRTVIFIGIFPIVGTVPAIVMIGIWALIQLLSGFATFGMASEGGIAFFAHIGGFVAGLILARPFARNLDRARDVFPGYGQPRSTWGG